VIYGGSYGGFAVLSAMTEHPDLWKAGVDIVGISNFVTFLNNTAAWRRSIREAEYGSLDHDMETLERISPIHKVDNIAAPLFIIQGDNDERVPLSESIQIHEKLKEKGLPVQLFRFADEGHGLAKLENRIQAYNKVISWLKDIV
jgi:dipeptidyl aminopeptidase/acylaminoacyl peptidase